MQRAILIKMASATETTIFCAEQDGQGNTKECGQLSVEITDGTAILCVARLWLAGTTLDAIAAAMRLGLLPPKTK
jgi:hypothetical protein